MINLRFFGQLRKFLPREHFMYYSIYVHQAPLQCVLGVRSCDHWGLHTRKEWGSVVGGRGGGLIHIHADICKVRTRTRAPYTQCRNSSLWRQYQVPPFFVKWKQATLPVGCLLDHRPTELLLDIHVDLKKKSYLCTSLKRDNENAHWPWDNSVSVRI